MIGGGMAGLATALDLAERGRSVVLLERHRVGWGASGRNGGFVVARLSHPARGPGRHGGGAPMRASCTRLPAMHSR